MKKNCMHSVSAGVIGSVIFIILFDSRPSPGYKPIKNLRIV